MRLRNFCKDTYGDERYKVLTNYYAYLSGSGEHITHFMPRGTTLRACSIAVGELKYKEEVKN